MRSILLLIMIALLCSGAVADPWKQYYTPEIPDKVLDAPARKGQHNPHPGWFPGALDEAGGPDAGGYVFLDSQEPGGPTFQWIDISGTGTQVTGIADDDYHGPVTLPWNFTYYDNTYSDIYICSNGYLMFGGGSTVYNNTAIPSSGSPNNILCFFWDDLNPASGGTIYYGMSGNNWVCQFQDVREYGGSGTITAEIIIREDGHIIYQYQSLGNGIDINGETIGIENSDGTTGLLVALDGTPSNYPFNQLAIDFYQLPPDASVSGVVTDAATLDPIAGATVSFGSIDTVTQADGSYQITQIWAGTYDVHIRANGYFDHRQDDVTVNTGANIYNASLDSSGFPSGLVGLWEFDNAGDLTGATIGNDLVLVGSHSAVAGPTPEDGAANIGVGSFYRCYHDIPANGALGNPAWVNQFTIVMDVRIPTLGDWYCLYQTNYGNSNDGDCFINAGGNMGVAETGYSSYSLIPGEWYRLTINSNLGVAYNYYLDGQLLHLGGAQAYEGRFSLYPASGANQVLYFADNNNEDGPIDVARIALFDRDLSPGEMASLGGYGHEFQGPEIPYMDPYLQSPTDSSLYVCWHSDLSTESIVEYGTTMSLGMSATGGYYYFNSTTVWHWVKLENLEPMTEYYYQCVTDTGHSSIRVFQTPMAKGDRSSHLVFGIYGDNRTDHAMHRAVVDAMEETLIDIYGEDYHQDMRMVFNVGDIVTNGNTLSQYVTEYFNPIMPLSDAIPYMVAIGNHEVEASHYYNYMKYEDFAGPEGERYYSFVMGPVMFISLNSNTQGATQLSWLQDVLDSVEVDDDIDWVFTGLHHPGHSEVWPDGNTSWVQNQVIPLLAQYEKTEMLSYGHSHNYERGAISDASLHLLLSGGGGSGLDRWRMYGNQTDYPELHRSFDYYCYNIIDIDCENHQYSATAYSLGHGDLPMNNVLFDSWIRDLNTAFPETPTGLAPVGQGGDPITLVASPFVGENDIMSSHFQLTVNEGQWSPPLLEKKRDWEDIYYDTGAPDYIPIDWNQGIDLTRLSVPGGVLQLGQTAWWRVRYRDQNLQWSNWSDPQEFVVTTIGNIPDFTADVTEGIAPLTVHFTDLSTGNPIGWSWDLDGDGAPDSYDRDPVWTYDNPGTFDVSLTTNFGAEQLAETKENYIDVYPVVPSNIDDLAVERSSNNVRLIWSPVTTDTSGNAITISYYTVFRSSSDPFFIPVSGDSIGAVTPPDTTFLDQGVLIDPMQFYNVKAVVGGR